MCRTVEEIKQDNIILQEVDEFISENNIDPVQKLILRVVRRNFIATEQIKDDQEPLLDFLEDSKESPSIIWLLKNQPQSTMAVLFSVFSFLYVTAHIIEHFLGFEAILKAWIP